jgi:predicted phosphodiesterase
VSDDVDWLPLKQASARLGISPDKLRSRRQQGKIEVKKPGKDYLYAVPKGATATSEVTPDEWQALRELVQPAAPQGATYTVLSLYDVHVPEADAFALKAVIDFAKDVQPSHVVIGGDFLELESCSQHGGCANPRALVDELKAGRKALDRLRDACPTAAMTYLEGNHETRLSRVVASALPTFDGALDLPSLLKLGELGCEWLPYRKLWTPPVPGAQLSYTHGEWANLHHAKKHLDAYGTSVRYGHTHRPQTHSRSFGDGRVLQSIGTGCLRTLDPSWIGPNNSWSHGFGYDEFAPDGSVTAHNVVMTKRAFAWGGKVYGKSAS